MIRQNRTKAQPSSERVAAVSAPQLLDTPLIERREASPIQPHAPPEGAFSHWLSVNQIRRMQRMRRSVVTQAMDRGELPFEQRGRIRYARLSDVLLWEERRLAGVFTATRRTIRGDLAQFIAPRPAVNASSKRGAL
jgi:hypothetical protein